MVSEKESQRMIAEYLRLAHKELRWVAKNIAAVHDLMRPEDVPAIEDPNQLKLFNDDNIRTDE